jgi:hypothetical protein
MAIRLQRVKKLGTTNSSLGWKSRNSFCHQTVVTRAAYFAPSDQHVINFLSPQVNRIAIEMSTDGCHSTYQRDTDLLFEVFPVRYKQFGNGVVFGLATSKNRNLHRLKVSTVKIMGATKNF